MKLIDESMYVEVKGKKMFCRTMGSGQEIIVILPGYNVQLPSVEFAPLMRKLAAKYTVCTLEFFGYGRSDSTDEARTSENFVTEIRCALKEIGLKPPYHLLPYSIAGIYAEYYAANFP